MIRVRGVQKVGVGMVKNGDVITLSKREAKEIADKECRRRLGISLAEFQQKRRRGELSELSKPVAVHDIEALLRFV